MKILRLIRYAFCICATVAIQAGCGGSQPATTSPQALPAIVPARTGLHRVVPAQSFQIVYEFKEGSDGARPWGGLVAEKDQLYGTTLRGGAASHCGFYCGTVYNLTTGGAETVLHRFDLSDGALPKATLIRIGDTLYGTTQGGGTSNRGTVFSISTGGVLTLLHNFGADPDGALP